MKPKINIRLTLQIIIGFMAFAIWTFMVWNDASLRGDYLKFVVLVVTTLAAIVLRDMPANPPPPKPPIESQPPQEPAP